MTLFLRSIMIIFLWKVSRTCFFLYKLLTVQWAAIFHLLVFYSYYFKSNENNFVEIFCGVLKRLRFFIFHLKVVRIIPGFSVGNFCTQLPISNKPLMIVILEETMTENNIFLRHQMSKRLNTEELYYNYVQTCIYTPI